MRRNHFINRTVIHINILVLTDSFINSSNIAGTDRLLMRFARNQSIMYLNVNLRPLPDFAFVNMYFLNKIEEEADHIWHINGVIMTGQSWHDMTNHSWI